MIVGCMPVDRTDLRKAGNLGIDVEEPPIRPVGGASSTTAS